MSRGVLLAFPLLGFATFNTHIAIEISGLEILNSICDRTLSCATALQEIESWGEGSFSDVPRWAPFHKLGHSTRVAMPQAFVGNVRNVLYGSSYTCVVYSALLI